MLESLQANISGSDFRSRVGPETHAYQIIDFFAIRGVLFGRGIVEHEPCDFPDLGLRLWDGTVAPVPRQVDPQHISGPKRTCFHFSYVLPQSSSSLQRSRIALYIWFRENYLLIESPGDQIVANNPFLRSETAFWNAVDAAAANSRVLEVGSRARSGVTRRHRFPQHLKYSGFDILAGQNVDEVGDAHDLSLHYPRDYFNFCLSIAVWEHLAMPWKVVLELNAVMQQGALVLICTQQTWPVHEEPWDYFRFSHHAWPTLFNAETGFEILDSGMGFPAIIASAAPVPYLEDQLLDFHYGFLASACLARKVSPSSLTWPVSTHQVSQGNYPH